MNNNLPPGGTPSSAMEGDTEARAELRRGLAQLRCVADQQRLFDNLNQISSLPRPAWHVSAYSLGNAGDYLLVHALQRSLEQALPPWERRLDLISRPCHPPVGPADMQAFNLSQGVIIGGGGLFLRDTNANAISGWQFPMSAAQYRALSVPLAVLAVGYNRFRGQPDFDEVFRDNLNALVEKSCFVGIRNHGSIRRLCTYLDAALHDKLIFHPCATTILRRLYRFPPRDDAAEPPFIALNCAFDRAELRFGPRADSILTALAEVLAGFTPRYGIKYYAHMPADEHMLPYLQRAGVRCKLVRLYNPALVARDFMRLYSAPALVLGMRGHAQMIPFGCGTPILSLITHDKLAWFLEDIGHSEWGVEVTAPDFRSRLHERMSALLEQEQQVRAQIDEAQGRLADITRANLSVLYRALRTAAQMRDFEPI